MDSCVRQRLARTGPIAVLLAVLTACSDTKLWDFPGQSELAAGEVTVAIERFSGGVEKAGAHGDTARGMASLVGLGDAYGALYKTSRSEDDLRISNAYYQDVLNLQASFDVSTSEAADVASIHDAGMLAATGLGRNAIAAHDLSAAARLQAVESMEPLGPNGARARALATFELGRALHQLSNPEAAVLYYQRAVEMTELLHPREREQLLVAAWIGTGRVRGMLRQPEAAWAAYARAKEVLDRSKTLGDRPRGLLRVDLLEGEALQLKVEQRPLEALDRLKKINPLLSRLSPADVIRIQSFRCFEAQMLADPLLTNLRLELEHPGRPSKTVRALEQAWSIANAANQSLQPLLSGGEPFFCLHQQAEISRQLGETSRAIREFKRALAAVPKAFQVEFPLAFNRARLGLTGLLLEENRISEARRVAAELITGELLTITPEHRVHGLTLQGILAGLETRSLRSSRLVTARRLFREAIQTYEDMRRSAERNPTALLSLDQSPYDELAATFLETRDWEQAWLTLERSRGRILRDLLNTRAATNPNGLSGEDDYEQSSLLDVLDVLQDDEAVLGWLDTSWGERGGGWVYVISPSLARQEGPVVWRKLPAIEKSTSHQSTEWAWRDYLRGSRSPSLSASTVLDLEKRIWHRRFSPIAELINPDKITRLIVVQGGTMARLPIEALRRKKKEYLIGRYKAVTYTPSVSVLVERRTRSRKARPRSALLIDRPPVYRTGILAWLRAFREKRATHPPALRSLISDCTLDSTPLTRPLKEETAGLEALFDKALVLKGAAASETRVLRLAERKLLQSFDVIHLASHGISCASVPLRSAVILSQAREEGHGVDGLLSAHEVMGWDLTADLVTLSSCEGGLGRETSDEGYFGFPHALLSAGSESVLVSLWKVEPTTTAKLMNLFYRNWLSSGGKVSKSAALAAAKRSLLEDQDDPRYWAAFILVGESN